jgi:hypothetical protein
LKIVQEFLDRMKESDTAGKVRADLKKSLWLGMSEPQYVLCDDEDMMIGHESGAKNCWTDNRQFDAGGVKTTCLHGTLKKPC